MTDYKQRAVALEKHLESLLKHFQTIFNTDPALIFTQEERRHLQEFRDDVKYLLYFLYKIENHLPKESREYAKALTAEIAHPDSSKIWISHLAHTFRRFIDTIDIDQISVSDHMPDAITHYKYDNEKKFIRQAIKEYKRQDTTRITVSEKIQLLQSLYTQIAMTTLAKKIRSKIRGRKLRKIFLHNPQILRNIEAAPLPLAARILERYCRLQLYVHDDVFNVYAKKSDVWFLWQTNSYNLQTLIPPLDNHLIEQRVLACSKVLYRYKENLRGHPISEATLDASPVIRQLEYLIDISKLSKHATLNEIRRIRREYREGPLRPEFYEELQTLDAIKTFNLEVYSCLNDVEQLAEHLED